jgi:hypothetical protein
MLVQDPPEYFHVSFRKPANPVVMIVDAPPKRTRYLSPVVASYAIEPSARGPGLLVGEMLVQEPLENFHVSVRKEFWFAPPYRTV